MRFNLAAGALLLAFSFPVSSIAGDVFIPVAPVTVGGPVVIAPVYLAPATQRLLSAQGLSDLAPVQKGAFLDRFFDNNSRNGMAAPVMPTTPRTPKAKPVVFKDLTIQRANFSEKTNISQILVDLIDRADTTLDMAVHGLKLPNVTEALLRAKKRGVKIRIIMNYSHVFPGKPTEKVSDDIKTLIAEKFDMRTLRGTGPYGVMHNKIIIVDKKVLKFGSFNWTTAANDRNYENAVFTDAAKKIARYEAKYEELWAQAKPVEDGELTYSPLTSEPQGVVPVDLQENITFNGETFESEMWSPNGGVKAALVRAINASQKEIVVAMFSLNAPEVVDALIAARDRGVKVKIVVDKSQAVGPSMRPAIKKFQDAAMDLVWSAGHAPKSVMHNKFAVFDRKMLEVGSYNWTGNAEEHNFENANFTDEPELIADFLAEFDDIYSVGTEPNPKEAEMIEHLVAVGHYDPMNE